MVGRGARRTTGSVDFVTALEGDLAALGTNDFSPGTRLVLIRHGEAVSNTDDLIGGHRGCRGLTERGIAQCEALARRLERTGELSGVAAVWTSVLPRAVESARIVAPVLGVDGVFESYSLCEQHPGEADGLTWAEYERRYLRRSLPGEDPELPISPGGENWVDFLDRAASALVGLAHRYAGEAVVVVTHGGVVGSSFIRFLGLSDHGGGVQLHVDNTSITEWVHTGRRWRLVRLNDAGHLFGTPGRDILPRTPIWVDVEDSLSEAADQQL